MLPFRLGWIALDAAVTTDTLPGATPAGAPARSALGAVLNAGAAAN